MGVGVAVGYGGVGASGLFEGALPVGAPAPADDPHHVGSDLSSTAPPGGLRWAQKRALDIVVATLALLVLAPVLLVLAVAIRIDSPGPVFFRQVRVGRDRRPFRMWKFRSMTADAEARLAEVAALNQADPPFFKVPEDPRTTRLGRHLRRFYLDEIPQLINVVRGEMSLVGPRPILFRELEARPDLFADRTGLTPGITGLWQIARGHWLPADQRAELDRRYLDSWGLRTDLRILARTAVVALGGPAGPLCSAPARQELAPVAGPVDAGPTDTGASADDRVAVSVVVVTHESVAEIGACLRSLEADVGSGRAEVVVVDNASRDGTVELVQRDFPWATIVRGARRQGFAANCNLGASRARGRHLLLLNPDAELLEGSLELMIDHLESHPAAGVVGPRLVYPDGRPQSSARRFPGLRASLLRRTPLRLLVRDSEAERTHLGAVTDLTRPSDVDWLLGAAMMFRAGTYRELGGMDERYRLYCEDIDICWRLRRAGWQVHYLPAAVGIHALSELTRHHFWTRLTLWHGRSMLRLVRRTNLRILGAGAPARPVLSGAEQLPGDLMALDEQLLAEPVIDLRVVDRSNPVIDLRDSALSGDDVDRELQVVGDAS